MNGEDAAAARCGRPTSGARLDGVAYTISETESLMHPETMLAAAEERAAELRREADRERLIRSARRASSAKRLSGSCR